MNRFVTYFDVQYAARGLALIESLWAVRPAAQWSVLCLDAETQRILSSRAGKRIETISCQTLAEREPRLASVRDGRSPWEFYATQKPALIEHALDAGAPGELVTYIDADTLFFSDPAPVLAAAEEGSVAISPHRFSQESAHAARFGTFNAGFGIWRNDAHGRACLRDWREQCLEWCYCRVEGTRFMNQGYLNDWPSRCERLVILSHPGQNLAPWNVGSHVLTRDRSGVRVDGQPLVFYHFSGLFRSERGSWQTLYTMPSLRQDIVVDGIYRPYFAAMSRTSRWLQRTYGIDGLGSVRRLAADTPLWEVGA